MFVSQRPSAFMAEGEQVGGEQQSGFCRIDTASVADYEVARLHGADTLCACVCVFMAARHSGKCGIGLISD